MDSAGRRVTLRSRRAVRSCAAVVLALLLTACGAGGDGSVATTAGSPGASVAEGPRVVATTTVLGDVAGQVVGPAGEVTTLLPRGADPHTFQPSAQQVAQLTDTDLVVTNGAGLEEAMEAALEEAERAGAAIFRATDHVDTLAAGEAHSHHDYSATDEHAEDEETDAHAEDEETDAGNEGAETGDGETDAGHEGAETGDEQPTDPHVWMDPGRMAEVARALGDQLAAVAGGDGEGFAERADAYADELATLDADIEELLVGVPPDERVLVTNHDALAYFADRYGFEIAGTVIPTITTGAEPSAEDIEQLAGTIRAEQVPAIFAETTQPERLAETVAAEVGRGVEIVALYTGSLGEEGGGAATYLDMMRTNADRIAAALAG